MCDGFLTQAEIADKDWQAVVDCLDGWAVPNLCLQADFKQLLSNNQFKNVVFTDITPETMPSADYMYKVSKRLEPVQKLSQWMGLRNSTQTANFKVGLAQHHLFHEKIVEYGVFTAQK